MFEENRAQRILIGSWMCSNQNNSVFISSITARCMWYPRRHIERVIALTDEDFFLFVADCYGDFALEDFEALGLLRIETQSRKNCMEAVACLP